ncbi:MAG: hypothetical protein M3R24_07530 [Chloroflexota bacterium]|nr:hypothetical protein [Chloroflexota bacterium]
MTTSIASRSRSIWVWVAAALALDLAGAQHVYLLPTVAAAALTGLLLLWLVPETVWQFFAHGAAGPLRLLALLPIVGFAAAMIDVATFVPVLKEGGGWTALRLWLLAGGIAALLLATGGRRVWIAVVALVLGTAVRMIHMDHVQIIPTNGDMLPLVQGALDNLLAGRSPYRMYQMPWEVPLTYLPTTWLAYLPSYLLGVDLRWTNVVAEIVILGALAWLSAQRSDLPTTLRSEPALVLWAWLYLQPSVIHWDTGNTAPITWALLAVTFALVLAGRAQQGAVALGLTAAGTPLVAVFAPFVGLHWLRRYGFTATARLVLISGIVAGIVVTPFLLWAPQDFITGTYRWFNNIAGWPRQKWLETDPHIWSIITGYSGEFWSRGTERWLKPIQGLIAAVVALVYWLRGARAEMLSSHAAAAYLGFMLFNPVLWPYLYNPVLIVGLVGVAALAVAQAEPVAVSAPAADAARRKPSLTYE